MSAPRYRYAPRPWGAAIETNTRGPRHFFGRLVIEAASNGLFAGGPLQRLAGITVRTALRPGAVAALTALLPARPRPDVDAVLADIRAAWPQLVRAARRLPPEPADLHALALERRAGLTVFVFAGAPEPVLVAKVGGRGVANEAAALREAEPADLAPRALGAAGRALVQEAVEGAPMPIAAIPPALAAKAPVTPELASLGDALIRLAGVSAKAGSPVARERDLRRSVEHGELDAGTRGLVAAATRDLGRLERAVLWHRDVSPQNCLCAGGRLTGLVDWELAETRGIPGWDVFNAALSTFESGVGLHRFSGRALRRGFTAAWPSAPLFAWSREAGREAAAAAGVPAAALGALELAFYAVRLGQRIADPAAWATDAGTAAHMVRVVAES